MLTYITALPSFPRTGRGPVAWLIDLDAAWRGARHLREITDAQLTDIGLTRADAEVAYRR